MPNNNPGCLGILSKLFGAKQKPKEGYIEEQKEEPVEEVLPYVKRDDFLSKAELSFYKVLLQAVGEEATICPKVSLSDIFFVNIKDKSWQTKYYNKIARKHVDFLICSEDILTPLCGIELDDSSHKRENRIERDIFVDKVFESAGLKLLRFENKAGYAVTEIKAQLAIILGNNDKKYFENVENVPVNIESDKNLSPVESDSTDVPVCNKCGIPMVIRKAKKGDRKGQEFFGCVNFPKCREVVKI